MWLSRAKIQSVTGLSLLLVLALSTPGLAIDFILGQGEGLAGNAMLSEAGATSLVEIPSGGLKAGGWIVESGYSRVYDLSDLDQFFFAGAFRKGKLIAAGGLSSLGSADLYSELSGKMTLSYALDSIIVGGSFSGRLLQFGGGYDNLSAVGFGLGGSYRFTDFIASAKVDNINSPKYYDRALPLRPVYSLHTEYRGKDSYSVLARMTASKDFNTQFSLSQRIIIAANGAIVWGLSTEPLKYGGGIEMNLLGGKLAYSFSIHPVLGFSHIISISVGSFVGRERPTDEFK